jgi:hypothetical protein
VLGLSISILVAAAAFAFYAWQFWSTHNSKGRATQILYWIEHFLCGHGHVTGIKWISKSEFEVPLRLVSNVFNRASVRVQMADGKVLWKWSRRTAAEDAETITFRADLDYKPAFNVELNNMRWFARSTKDNDPTGPGWTFESVAPVVLTTRLDWEKEVTAAFQSMMTVENKEDLQVRFCKTSPHFTVTLPLAKITPGSEMPVFELLNSIATVSSAEAS